jgi:hypothetical protein
MNNRDMIAQLKTFPKLSYFFGNSPSKIAACNADISLDTKWDIIVLVSDDMIPIVPEFDKVIVSDMKANFPDTDGALHYNDGLFGKDNTITLSIMGRKLYEYFGYMYHPDYKSFYCDNEFTEVVRALKKHYYNPKVIIQHKWHGGPGSEDDLYKKNSRDNDADCKTYNNRKALGFPK